MTAWEGGGRRGAGGRAGAAALVCALSAFAGAGADAAAQEVASAPDSVALRRHDFAALAVASRPWTTVAVVTLAFPRGSSDDPRELPGAAALLAEAVRAEADRSLGPGTATVSVEVGRTRTILQALAVPEEWERVQEALVRAAFVDPLHTSAVARRREELLELFRFESGAPVREFETELYRLIGGGDEGWSHDPRGTPESLERIVPGDLEALRRSIYRREEAVVTVVGNVAGEPGERVFPGAGPGGDVRLPSTEDDGPWDDGDHERLVSEVTNTWIGAAFPVAPNVPRTLLEFLQHRVREELNPDPADPDLFGTQVRIEELPEGPVLLVEAAVLPEAQERWEARILATVENLGERHRDPGLFRFHRRRFRSARLTVEGRPEVQGRRMALDLLREGRLRDIAAEIAAMQPAQVMGATSALGEPRILVFGPDLGDGTR